VDFLAVWSRAFFVGGLDFVVAFRSADEDAVVSLGVVMITCSVTM
jgi:hypothetical protein